MALANAGSWAAWQSQLPIRIAFADCFSKDSDRKIHPPTHNQVLERATRSQSRQHDPRSQGWNPAAKLRQ